MWVLDNDVKMYHAETDSPAVARSTIVSDLGRVDHVFSDKTGTLTSNLMSFRRCYVCGVEYGVGETAIARSLRAMAEASDRPPEVKVSTRPLPAHGEIRSRWFLTIYRHVERLYRRVHAVHAADYISLQQQLLTVSLLYVLVFC